MTKITKFDLLLSITSAVLFPISFTIPYAGILAWFLLAPFFMALENKSPGNGFKLGLLTGTVANAVGSYWLIGTIYRFGGFPYPISFVFHLILSAYSGLFFAVFAYVATGLNFFRGTGLLSALLIAAVWTSLEFLFPYLFPYGITNTQADYLPLMQIYELFGMYSLSFLIVLVNVALMRLVKRFLGRRQFPTSEVATSLILLVLVVAYGFWKIDVVDKQIAKARKIRVGIVQANFDFDEKNENNQERVTRKHKLMSEGLNSPDLIVWPETAIQAWFPVYSDFLIKDGEMAIPPTQDSYFLVGGLSYKIEGNASDGISDEEIVKFNTAFLTNPQGEILGRYNKIKLLLFGEYLPFSKYIPAIKELSPATGDFTPGHELNLLEIEEKGIRIAPLICYEDIIPSFSRKLVNRGANLIVNMTNDAWFGRSVEPYQHLVVSIPRAVETRLYLVRATNTGISAIIDPVGRVVAKTEIFEQTTVEEEVGIMDGEKTLYTKIGNVFPWGCLVFWTGFLVVTKVYSATKARRHKEE